MTTTLTSESQASTSGLPPSALTLVHSLGYESSRHTNIAVVASSLIYLAGELADDCTSSRVPSSTVCAFTGNVVVLTDLLTGKHTYIRSTSGQGLGSLAVHPSQK